MLSDFNFLADCTATHCIVSVLCHLPGQLDHHHLVSGVVNSLLGPSTLFLTAKLSVADHISDPAHINGLATYATKFTPSQ